MSERVSAVKRIRKNFGKIHKIVDIPDLIGMQRESYQRFLQINVPAEKREDIGLQAVFKSVFPIRILPEAPPWNSSPTALARSNTRWTSVSTVA